MKTFIGKLLSNKFKRKLKKRKMQTAAQLDLKRREQNDKWRRILYPDGFEDVGN